MHFFKHDAGIISKKLNQDYENHRSTCQVRQKLDKIQALETETCEIHKIISIEALKKYLKNIENRVAKAILESPTALGLSTAQHISNDFSDKIIELNRIDLDPWENELLTANATEEDKKALMTRLQLREIQQQQTGVEGHYALLAYLYMLEDDVTYLLIKKNILQISIIEITPIDENDNDDEEKSTDNNTLQISNAVLKLTYQNSYFYWGVQHGYFSDDDNGLKYVAPASLIGPPKTSLLRVGDIVNNANNNFQLRDITNNYNFRPIENEALIKLIAGDSDEFDPYNYDLCFSIDKPENCCTKWFGC